VAQGEFQFWWAVETQQKGTNMSKILTGALLVALAVSTAACQTRTGTGAAAGAVGGAVVGGPVGAAVGAAGGAVVGAISDAEAPRFREFVVREQRPSYTYQGDIVVGTVLPPSGVVFYDVPSEFDAPQYRYTIVNGRTVLVDPQTRTIVQIIG
jgi:Protein of unknown function (DUF1236)